MTWVSIPWWQFGAIWMGGAITANLLRLAGL
jgi:hypothetical protein